jgi:DNA-binding CsgD family transcriptional regulator/pimeloyl-ACP methyl ester carboxylesterase
MKQSGPLSMHSSSAPLELLQSIVDVGLHPENFSNVCKAWAEQGDNKETLNNFESLLNTVYLQNSKYFESRLKSNPETLALPIDEVEEGAFLLNDKLEIIAIGSKAQEAIKLSVGETAESLFEVDPAKILESANAQDQSISFGDIIGTDGTRHLASVFRLDRPNNSNQLFKFTLWKIDLPPEAEAYIRDNLHLTDTELSILKLCLYRHSVNEIAELRGSSVNTVRTHIKNLKHKFRSKSLIDVISSTHEIIAIHHTQFSGSTDFKNDYVPHQRNVTLAKLPASPYQVEYSRYGRPEDKPLVILHSIEYGILPPKQFLESALHKGFCVYIPVRPGFGRTTSSDSITQSAVILNQFLETLGLNNITLVALSTSAPTALKLITLNKNIHRKVFVNYAFNVGEKLQNITPVWLRGLLEFGLGTPESFKFAFRMSKGMLKVIGYKRFYKKLYQSCEEDLLYLAQNEGTLKASANLILSAEPESCRNDFVASFLDNPDSDKVAAAAENIYSIFGEHTHGIALDPIEKKAHELGLSFHVIKAGGRNCIYQKPDIFFDILDSPVSY